MPCERIELDHKGEKVVVTVCSRGGRTKRCACGKPGTRLCDYPKPSKRKRDKTCDAPMCVACAVHIEPNRDLCAEHAKAVRSIGWPAELLADPHPHAMVVVADIVEQREVTKPCAPGDAAAAIANLERTIPKDEAGSFVVRTRSDVFDTEAVDFVLERAAFKPRDLADWQEFLTERAAMFEFLAEKPRAVAESMARQLAGPPPRGAKHGPLFAGVR